MDKVKEKMINIKIKESTHRRLRSASFFLMKDMQDFVDEIVSKHLDTFDYVGMAKSLQKREV